MNECHVFSSNQLEILAERLARVISRPLSDPFSPEIIVVQSIGMQRWVSMEIARHNGICANCYFPFPNRFMNDLCSRMNPALPEKSPFDPVILTFRIMQLLPEVFENPEFHSLRFYLNADINKMKLFQLSQKIADAFDQYLVFRPDMILSWEAGREDHWQAFLWRRLIAGFNARHRAGLRDDLMSWIRKQPPGMEDLPERISVFGISYLPPFHLQVLSELSRQIPVYLFLMNPCKEYWADIVSRKEKVRIQRKFAQTRIHEDAAELHLEGGNRLLSSWGGLGRDFFERITAADFNLDECFMEPGRGSLLKSIQSDLLNLTESKPAKLSGNGGLEMDRSVQIHSCHSPMRELEVLYDQLLAMFESEPDLMPRDIVVMMPDIETYAPYIQSVFDVQDENGVRIPFTISDRSLKREGRAVEAFLAILAVKGSRFGAARIMSLLEFEAVREKFGLSESDLETIAYWIAQTHIRWGRDAGDRKGFGPEGFSENSWRQGLDRILLGYAMPGNDNHMFKGILPFDSIESEDSLILGKFLDFVEQLFQHMIMLDNHNKLSGWNEIFNAFLDKFILRSEAVERDFRILTKIFAEFAETETLSRYHDEVAFEIARTMMLQRLERENEGHGFISGGLTFCAMLPMRSIPFKVICLIGMNSDAFPRENRALGFDFMLKTPRPGDRSRRNDDKYLFLEALISARDTFYVSYIGQSLQDNSELPPSVLVSELIDYIKQGFGFPEERIVDRHPLQAFSSIYFSKSHRFFSYSQENQLAAASLAENMEGNRNPPPFFSNSLPIQPEDVDKWKVIDLKDFCTFWANPAKFLLQQRLDIFLREEKPLPEDREHFNIDSLERYSIGQRIVEQKINGVKPVDLLALFRAQGRLPIGSAGRAVFHELEIDAQTYLNRNKPYMTENVLPPLDVNMAIEGFHLTGHLEGICPPAGLVRFIFANLQVKYLLNIWIQHLIYNWVHPERRPGRSILVCKDAVWEFSPVSPERQFLSSLATCYSEGLTQPLHFFPETSFVYTRLLLQKGKDRTTAIKAARQKWTGSDFYRGESQDPYLNLLFSRSDPFDERFHDMAVSVFTPVFQYGRDITQNL